MGKEDVSEGVLEGFFILLGLSGNVLGKNASDKLFVGAEFALFHFIDDVCH